MAKAQAIAAPEKSEEDYEAQNAADTLIRAGEIHGNPGLHKRAMKHVHRKAKATTAALGMGKALMDEKC